MDHSSHLSAQLTGIQDLLLTPNPQAMQEAETRLAGLIAVIRESGATRFEPGVRSGVQGVRFLLERAKQFWDRRQTLLAPGLQYTADGALVENSSPSTFAVEL
jgi:hypothetical protein